MGEPTRTQEPAPKIRVSHETSVQNWRLAGFWRELRARLADTEPTKFESRTEFIARLRRAVAWINNHRAEYLKNLCMSQKERASDVLDAKGARTRH